MPKRKYDGDVPSHRQLRAASFSERCHRTVAQIATGSIGIHRVAPRRASLLGLPREIRDLIYSYIPHEISCVPEKLQSRRVRYPHDASPYTNDSPAPAMYEGVSIGSQVVDELAQLSRAKSRHIHPMFSICQQLRKEYLEFFHRRNFQAQRMHFLVRAFNFKTVIQVIKKWRPAHVVIELCDDYYWQEGAERNLRQWYQSCRPSSLARLGHAEIDGHHFRLTYQRELRYHSPSLLARGRKRQYDMLRDILRPKDLSLMAQTRSERITRQAIVRHIAKAIDWIDTHNGNKVQAWKGCIKAARRDVKIAKENSPFSGLMNTSKLLGRKRDFEDMEAGGRADPLDAKMRALAKRWAMRQVQPTLTHDRAAEARATSEISGNAKSREYPAKQVNVETGKIMEIQTQKDAKLDNMLEELGKMNLKGSGSERIGAAGTDVADEMEVEPKEVVNEKDLLAMDLKIVIEQMSKLKLCPTILLAGDVLTTGSTATTRHLRPGRPSLCHAALLRTPYARWEGRGYWTNSLRTPAGVFDTSLRRKEGLPPEAKIPLTTEFKEVGTWLQLPQASITPFLYVTGTPFGIPYQTTSAIGNMASDDASSKGSQQPIDVAVDMVALEAQRSNATESTKATADPIFGEGEINYNN
ncbi:uncharacterized protein MYCFIDRAFT_76215, partial [Pseudocercospora fijiensis CIRAD86]